MIVTLQICQTLKNTLPLSYTVVKCTTKTESIGLVQLKKRKKKKKNHEELKVKYVPAPKPLQIQTKKEKQIVTDMIMYHNQT